MLRQQRAILASAPASAFSRAHYGIQPSNAYHREPCRGPSTPGLVAQRAHIIGPLLPPHRHIISEHIENQWKDVVRAKRHRGTQSTPSASPPQDPLTIPYSPSASQGLVQGSRILEETQKPVEAGFFASDAVELVESGTHEYPHAEGVVFTYPNYDAQRVLFEAVIPAITRTYQHKLAICRVTSSSRRKLRAFYFGEQLAICHRTFVRYLGPGRYMQSELYVRYCIRAKNTKDKRELRQALDTSAPERVPKERIAHRERVRALHDALMKKRTTMQQKGGRTFACKHLRIRKPFVMEDSVRYQPVQSKLKLQVARKESWRRRRGKRTRQRHFPPIVNTSTSLVRVLGILGFEANLGGVKANDVSGRDKGVHSQPRRHSTHNSLTRFNPSSRLQAPHPSVCYTESPILLRDSDQYESADSGNGPTKGSKGLDEGDTNNYTYNNDTPSMDNQYSARNNDTREDAEQSRDEEWENESSSENDADSECEIESESDEEQELHVSLSFQIPEDILREAMQASPNSQANFYSHRLYRGPEDQMPSVHYCRNIEVAERAAKLLVNEKVLGFDIEWKPWASPHSIKDNASLIQLASEDRIVLFHISLFSGDTPNELLPPTLKMILESPDITKVGVAIKGDFTRLKNHLGIEARGVFEISRLHNIVEHHTSPDKITKRLVSLARQTQQHLQLPLFKGDVRESDWSKQLDTDQLQYAATDAYAGLRIFDALEAKRKKLRPTPPLPSLCDSDERMHRRAKALPKSAASKKPEEIPKAVQATEQEEDTEEYETAPEELMDKRELEAASNSPTKTRRVSRVDFSRLKGGDPGYPKLPRISFENEDGSDSSDAFDPIPQTRPQRRAVKDATSQEASGHVDDDHNTSEFEDKEVEELMLAMDIDDVSKIEKGQSVITDNQQNEAEQRPTQLTSNTTLEQNGDGEWALASASVTAPPRKEKKKRKPRAVESTSAEIFISTGNTALPPPQFKPLIPDTTPKSPEYLLAEIWAQTYLRSSIPSPSTSTSFTSPPSRIRATVLHIRAYHLWHHQRLPLEEVAGHLRDPPLAISTVLNYIAQAVDLERLEYRNEDMRVLLAGLPLGLRMGRYRRLVDRVNGRGARGSGSDGWF